MKRFVEGIDRGQSTLFPECLEDWICEDNPVRVIGAFVEELDLAELKFLRSLTTVSNLVGACTGRSAGFSPLRMRSIQRPMSALGLGCVKTFWGGCGAGRDASE